MKVTKEVRAAPAEGSGSHRGISEVLFWEESASARQYMGVSNAMCRWAKIIRRCAAHLAAPDGSCEVQVHSKLHRPFTLKKGFDFDKTYIYTCIYIYIYIYVYKVRWFPRQFMEAQLKFVNSNLAKP